MLPSLIHQDMTNLDHSFSIIDKLRTVTNNLWYSDHALAVYVSFASAAILCLHILVVSKCSRPAFVWFGLVGKHDISQQDINRSRIEAHGGRVIFAVEVLTFLGSLELLYISVSRLLAVENTDRAVQGLSCFAFVSSVIFSNNKSSKVFSLQAYTSILSLFVIVYPRPTVVSQHITLVLATCWTVYFIRNVVPLLTYTESPADPIYKLWELISVLSFTGVLLPLAKPRRYVPFDISVSCTFLRPDYPI